MLKQFTLRSLYATLVILSLLAINHTANGQWLSAQSLGVSAQTHWDAMALDSSGNIFCAGISDKLPAPNTRKIVITKFDKNLTKIWDARLIGGATIYHTSIGVDAAGNSYTIGRFVGEVTRTDGSKFSSTSNALFIIKIDANGKEAWSKRLVVGDYQYFKVLPDGTICLFTSGGPTISWGDSVITPNGAEFFLEISADGGVRRAVNTGLFPDMGFLIGAQWVSPGKVRILDAPIAAPLTGIYASGDLDLDAKTITNRDSAKIKATNVSINQVEFEPSTGHCFMMVNTISNPAVVNGTDTLAPWSSNALHDAHILEFDEKMKLLHKIQVTNPFYFAVRDTQVAILANIKNTFGFVSPSGTIKSKFGFDGAILYVVNRDFKPSRQGIVMANNSSIYNDISLAIDKVGEITTSLTAGADLYYIRSKDTLFFASPLSSTASATAISKLGYAGQSAVSRTASDVAWSLYPNPAVGNAKVTYAIEKRAFVKIEVLNVLGANVATLVDRLEEAGSYQQHFNTSMLQNGSYFIRISADGKTSMRSLNVLR